MNNMIPHCETERAVVAEIVNGLGHIKKDVLVFGMALFVLASFLGCGAVEVAL